MDSAKIKVLAIIPARGGSKGLQKKNILPLSGLPLIAHTINIVRQSKMISRAIVTTDSDEIIECCKTHGGDVPFKRPAELSTDSAKTIDVVLHAMEYCQNEESIKYDYVMLLQPTQPLRILDDIEIPISLLNKYPEYETLASFCEASHVHPNIMYSRFTHNTFKSISTKEVLGERRQDFSELYIRNGSIYLTTANYINSKKSLMSNTTLAYIMPRHRSINIDSKYDLFLAEKTLEFFGSDL